MREKPRTHLALAELAGRQHGVVSATQLRELECSPSAIGRAVATGRLHRVHHGTYAVGHAALSQHGQCLAAVLACGSGALLSHRSAAWLWGLTTRWPLPVEVTASSPRQTRPEIRVHSAEALRDEDRSTTEGVPVTAIPRTLLDFAAVDPYFLDRALERAERLGLLDIGTVDALMSRSRGFRGVARLREALDVYRIAGFTRSGLERRFLGLIRDAGLPRPSTNCFVAGYELDAYWSTERFAVELDTYDYHGGPTAFEADRLRQEELKLVGIEMIRITGARLDREPNAVATRISRLLSQRHRDLQPSHPTAG